MTGLGDHAFCAGADLKERSGMTDADWRRQHAAFERAFAAIRDFAKPIFAAVNGLALGGGCEVALNADFIIAADHATFGQPEVRLGIMPGGGATQHLPRRIPQGLARQLLLTGETIDAEAALRCGLVNSVHPRASLRAVALEIAGRIAQNGPAAVREARASIRGGEGLPIDEAMRVELRHYDVLVDHPDRHEGVAAFLARRPPVFRDPD
jgi:enoyl-CoA hydratase